MRATLVVLLLLVAMTTDVRGLGEVVLNGDVYIELINSIYTESSCTTVDPEVVQNIQAIKWTLDQLNHQNFIKGVNIGLKVSATCGSVEVAKQRALRLIVETSTSDTNDVIGVIGSDLSSESEAISRMLSSLPDQHRLLQVSYAATSASLRNRELYRNFFRTIPADDIQAEVMAQFIDKLDWTFLAVIYDNNSYGQGGLDSLSRAVSGQDACFAEAIAVNPDAYNVTEMKGIIQTRIYRDGQQLPPISGIIVFGSYLLADTVIKAAQNLEDMNITSGSKRPIFLFSEAASYIEGQSIGVWLGSFVLSPPRRNMTEFDTHWRTLLTDTSALRKEAGENRLLKEMVEQVTRCSFNETDVNAVDFCRRLTDTAFVSKIPISVYNQYAIQAALVVAKATERTRNKYCGSLATCNKLRNSTSVPRSEFISMVTGTSITFDLDFGGFRISAFQSPTRIGIKFENPCDAIVLPMNTPQYEIENHQACNGQQQRPCFVKIAEYKSSALTIFYDLVRDYDRNGVASMWPNIRKPQCPDGFVCGTCESQLLPDAMLFAPGDMYVVGIVSVHNIGRNPLVCGSIKSGGLDIVEAIRVAVDESQTSFNGKLGVIIIDSCNDPQMVQEKIMTLYRRGVYVKGQYEPVSDKIIGFVGGWSSDVSSAVALLTGRLKYVQISYASTADSLSRRVDFPYFLRIPTPDRNQAEVLLNIVKTLHTDRTHIQILYSTTTYGEGGLKVLKQLAATPEYNMCVANEIQVKPETEPSSVVRNLRTQPGAKIVVTFLGSSDIAKIIEALQNMNDGEFLFIASEGWGLRHKLVGSISVAPRLWVSERLEKRIVSLVPSESSVNPWVRPYLEAQFGCYYEWSFNKSSNRKCNGTERLFPGTKYNIDSWAPFAERAVETLLSAARVKLLSHCQTTASVCRAFSEDVAGFVDELKKQTARKEQQDVKSYPVYDANGDGTIGYRIYMFDEQGDPVKIGTSDNDSFSLQTTMLYRLRPAASYRSSCNNSDACSKCFPPASPAPSTSASVPVGMLAAIVCLVVFAIVLTVAIVLVCLRHGCCLEIRNGRPAITDTYLTPVYMDRHKYEEDRRAGFNQRTKPTLPLRPGEQHYMYDTATEGLAERQPTQKTGEGATGLRVSHSGSLTSEKITEVAPPAHTFIKQAPPSDVTPSKPEVLNTAVFQADGGYITNIH